MNGDAITATLDAVRQVAHYTGPVAWLLPVVVLAELLDLVTLRKLNGLGITPREASGLPGIFLAPLLHVDLAHFGANLLPLALLSFALGQLLPGPFWWILFVVTAGSGLLVWLFARRCLHVGASGVVYGLFGFLTVHGLVAGDALHAVVALVLLVLYSGMLWGVLPTAARTSWESHLAGLGVGAALAWWQLY